MGPRVAVATCREFIDLVEDDRPVLAGLRAAGVDARAVAWDADADWASFSAVLLRSVWDYFARPAEFSAWLDRLEAAGVPCWNPVPLVRWNMDKRYLRELAAKGVATVETLWIARGDGVSGREAAGRIAAAGWDEVVVKPTVSGNAWRTLRLRRDELAAKGEALAEILSASDLMAQPFLPEIVAAGEHSLVFFDGAFSHAVVKRPRAGDYRVQWTHGGGQEPWTPPASIVEQAAAALEAAPSAGLYARVDGIVRDGRLIVVELEQIEPFLYLAEAPGSAARLVAALCARL